MFLRLKCALIAAGFMIALAGTSNAFAITIIGHYIGGTQLGTSFGGGNIHDIFRAAADIWERIILDDFTVTFDYGWGSDEAGGSHELIAQGGMPNREAYGRILVNPQQLTPGKLAVLFMDPTPYDNFEFSEHNMGTEDLGGGAINVEHSFHDSLSDFEYEDLLTIFLHEIAHGLGMSAANMSFVSESADGYINITSPLPFSGTAIPLATNNYGVTSHVFIDRKGPLLDGSGLPLSSRYMPSTLDILAVAQLSGFQHLNLDDTALDITIATNPEGLSFMVDGKTYYAAQAFSWPVGSKHTISAIAEQGSYGTRYVFANWSDGGAFSHTITMPANPTTFTLSYTTQYWLSASVSSDNSGSISANPASADGYCTSGSSIQLSAIANSGYSFLAWSGDLTGTTNLQTVTMSAPHSVTAIFLPEGSIALALNAGSAGAASTIGSNAATRAGYASLAVNSGAAPYAAAVFSLKQNGVTISEAGVPASPPTKSARIFIDFRAGINAIPGQSNAGAVNINTGIAVVNYGSETANVTYTLRDVNGGSLSTGHGTVAAGKHFACFIDQLKDVVASDFNLPSDFQNTTQFGSLDIISDQPLSVLALRGTNNQRNDFLITTTPVANLTQSLRYSSAYFPQFADGGGYTTSLVLLNTSNRTEKGILHILDDNGAPMVVNEAGGTAGSSFPYSILSGGAFRFQTDGSPADTKTGWIRVIPETFYPTPIGSGIFSYNPADVLITESGIPAATATTHARIYVDLSDNHNTGLAIANVTNGDSNITINAFQTDGVTAAGTSKGPLPLSANGHAAAFADQFVAGLPEGFIGVLDISSTTPFAALTLRSLMNERHDFLMTTFPIADVNQAAPSPIVFPHIADGGGYTTQFILLGPNGEANTTLSLYDESGAPLDFGD